MIYISFTTLGLLFLLLVKFSKTLRKKFLKYLYHLIIGTMVYDITLSLVVNGLVKVPEKEKMQKTIQLLFNLFRMIMNIFIFNEVFFTDKAIPYLNFFSTCI